MSQKQKISIHWFRQDLRLSDNPALHSHEGGDIFPIYIIEDSKKIGEASAWWLYHSLTSLNKSMNDKLNIYRGNARNIFLELIQKYDIQSVTWNRRYEPEDISLDRDIKTLLIDNSIACQSFNGSLLFEPWTILTKQQTPYKVYTPFYKKGCLEAPPPRQPILEPDNIRFIKDEDQNIPLESLLPKNNWYKKLNGLWNIGESEAQRKLFDFLEDGLNCYKDNRNFPSKQATSLLSAHLHFGEISPHQIWYAAKSKEGFVKDEDLNHYLQEIAWREFSYYLLYHFPKLPSKNFQSKFDTFPWKNDPVLVDAWKKGETGYPIVDAGMRELWETGTMHNRVRMIVASFLVKNLCIDWRIGADWFFDCLLDADLASNSASWQWVAGCGVDAAPYFRIFNPTTQGETFDPDGVYVKKYAPELRNLPLKYLFTPWSAPLNILHQSGITLGKTYPLPIVDLKESREFALKAYKFL